MVNVWTTVCTMSHCVVPQPAGSNGRPCIINEDVSAHWPIGLEAFGLISQRGGKRKRGSAMVCPRGNLTPHTPACDTFSPVYLCALRHKQNLSFLHVGWIVLDSCWLLVWGGKHIKRNMWPEKCLNYFNKTTFSGICGFEFFFLQSKTVCTLRWGKEKADGKPILERF